MSEISIGEDTDVEHVSDMEGDLPVDIELSSSAVEFAFHPSKDILAAGTEKGRVLIYSYSPDRSRSNHKLMSFGHHKKSCRAVQFSSSGDYLFTGSSDTTIHAIDLDVGAVVRRLRYNQGAAIYSLLPINDYVLASGDDDGRLIIWDFRRELPVTSLKPCVDYISSLKTSTDKRTMLATSGEGSLFTFDLRTQKLAFHSELYKDEFMTSAIIKKETKVVIGASEGVFYLFNWGEWNEYNEKFSCHTGSVDIIVAVEDVIYAGCDDGYIRAVTISPNRVIGVLGRHGTHNVDGLSVTHDCRYIASGSHDNKIKFHDLSIIKNLENISTE